MSRPLTSRKPVVLQVLHTLNIGGAEVLAARLARRLKERYEFVFVCLDALGSMGPELRSEGFPVEVLNRREGIDLLCVRKLAGVARDYKADLIQAHQYTPFFYARAPGWFGPRVPVMFVEHGRAYPDVASRKRRLFNRMFLRSVDRVVAVGEAVKRALVEKEAIPAQRIEVIYNGVRLDDFSHDDSLRQRMRAELDIANEMPVAIQVARLDYLKDHFTALRTAEKVRNVIPSFRLLLVGEGPERAKIEAEIAERKLAGTVQLLGLRADVRQLLAVADMFLLTSISEGIPVTFIEAMAARLPIVSTAVGGVEEVVLDGITGRIAPSGDDAQLACCVLELLQDRAAAQAMGAAGAKRAIELFSEQQMHESYARLFDRMVGKR